ncbi:ABC transporter ATP-binding protein [Ahrensia sp. R2A130]|uniref:ABC transporter ATP-binding protein n=1 Tax=Ahrensia sp. R2A130 TaxID=744979 RepID=UPI0001E083E7|nr:sn-glycerol-3-phosphate ABC transporter ATP-binding protein UgpC [Ahrensia sp. R2A130]EFL89230.1 lactose transport ATP-binding protein LacK [Ahrensia sp. R2A130]
MAGVTLRNVKKSFGDIDVIHGVDLDIEDGDFIVFVGPSGCGKSTLLRLVSGLEDISSGTIAIGGEDVTHAEPSDRGVAMVFQSYALYPHMTVYDNMAFGLKMNGVDAKEIDERVQKAAAILELGPLLDRKPAAMSGGQRQRVAIGRSIVRNPKVFLFDEPLSNLDAELRVQMRLEIAKLHNDLKNTMIYVTHDQTEAMTLADKIVVLRAGRVEQYGSPLELYDNPDNAFVAGFIGSPRMNFLDAEVTSSKKGSATVLVPQLGNLKITAATRDRTPDKGEKVEIGLRPEHFIAATGNANSFSAPTTVVEQLGGNSFLYLDVGGDVPLTVEQKGHTDVKDGDVAKIGVDPATAMLFGSDGLRI